MGGSMRYIKVLLLGCLIFLALVFFFQNQTVLSQNMVLSLNLYFLPPLKSISMPFYFLVLCAFLVGVLLAMSFLIWDRLNLSARNIKNRWYIKELERKLAKAEKNSQNDGGSSLFNRPWKKASQQPAEPASIEAEQEPKAPDEVKLPADEAKAADKA